MPHLQRSDKAARARTPEPPSGPTIPADGFGRESVGVTLAWRKRAFQWFLWAVLATGWAPLLIAFLMAPELIPKGYRYFSLGVYGLAVAVALARRAPHGLRVWLFLASGYALGGVMLTSMGLQGGGRILLLAIPLYAMVLIGRRSGWIAAGLSLTLFGLATLAVALGWIAAASLTYWLLQGAVFVLVLVPLMVLVNSFVAFLGEALAAEQEAADERRRLERLLAETAERERRTVGHQLHDGPCQQITAALMRCKVVENQLAANGPSGEAVAHVQAIARMLDGAVGEVHDLARGLSPTALDPGAFASAVGELAGRIRASGTVECEFHYDGDANPGDPVTSTQLFLLAQEAVNNALKHARPRRITIEFRRHQGEMRLAVADDGEGVDPREETGGLGLRIMHHRAELMGGTLTIQPNPGGGTRVVCTVPVFQGTGREDRA